MITAQEIMEKYPRLYSRGVICGFSCPEGWLNLVDNLSRSLDRVLERQVPDGKELVLTVAQVKSKFGGLRFYVGFTYDGEDSELRELVERMDGMISFAETISFSLCETCGAPAKTFGKKGWISTLCEKHSDFATS